MAAVAEEFALELVDVLMFDGDAGATLFLRIQRFHAANVSELMDAGKKAADYKCPFKTSLSTSWSCHQARSCFILTPTIRGHLKVCWSA